MKLSKSEWKVMDTIPNRQSISFPEISDILCKQGSAWSKKTIYTLLDRLVKKGAVHVDKTTSPHQYSLATDKDEYTDSVVSDVVETVFKGSPISLFSTMIANEKISDDDILQLEKMIKGIKDKRNIGE